MTADGIARPQLRTSKKIMRFITLYFLLGFTSLAHTPVPQSRRQRERLLQSGAGGLSKP
jgi:hypothetical protein